MSDEKTTLLSSTPGASPSSIQADDVTPGSSVVIPIESMLVDESEAVNRCGIQRNRHTAGLFCCFLLFAAIASVTAGAVLLAQGGLLYFVWPPLTIVMLVVVIAYLVEALKSGTARFLSNTASIDDVVSHIETVKARPVHLQLWCDCYHYETRVRIPCARDT